MSDHKQEQKQAKGTVFESSKGPHKDATLASYFVLKNGVKDKAVVHLPVLGLGVYQSANGDECYQAVRDALAAGYRHVDTAAIYQNEESVGRAIRDSKVPREEIFVTTKLWNSAHGFDKAKEALNTSLKKLGLDYVDLYLIHWPVPGLRKDTWRAMEWLLEQGKTRSIGVSNYMEQHLEELFGYAKVKPAVNQIELSPYLSRTKLVELCQKHDIVVTAYSPLTKGEKLKDKGLVEIAKHYNKSTAQVLIRWVLQQGCHVVPKSVNKQRIIDNANVFDFVISDDDMKILNSLNENLVTGWDPTDAP